MVGNDVSLIGRIKEKKVKKKKSKKSNKKKRKRDQQHDKFQDDPIAQPVTKELNEDCNHLEGVKPEPDIDTNMVKRSTSEKLGCKTSSWGDAFAMASSVKPIHLGEGYALENDAGNDMAKYGGGDIGLVSQIAIQYIEKSLPMDKHIKKNDVEETSLARDEAATKNVKRNSNIIFDAKDNGGKPTEKESNLSSKKKKKRKKDKHLKLDSSSASKKLCSDVSITSSPVKESDDLKNLSADNHFPYPTDPDDHCESPAVAYEDILPILEKLAVMKKGNKKLRIYDPYYCDGSVISNLSKLGFKNVYNKKEDCYEAWSELNVTQAYPQYDVLVTNPPYSNDHIQRLVQHIMSKSPAIGKTGTEAWCLLMPTYVHKKDYYKEIMKKASCQPFYLVPKKRYVYIPPKNFRAKKESDVHKKSSPFVSMWYVWGGTKENNEKLMAAYKSREEDSSCDFARSKSALRDLRRKKP